jgi:hypothetical protein
MNLLKNRNAIGSLVIFFPNCESEVIFRDIIKFSERNEV